MLKKITTPLKFHNTNNTQVQYHKTNVASITIEASTKNPRRAYFWTKLGDSNGVLT